MKNKIILFDADGVFDEFDPDGAFNEFDADGVFNEFDADVTHLLADVDENGFCHRTTKYLLALLHGCWIVRSDCMCSTPQ